MAIVLYRGPFQGQRLRFLLQTISRAHTETEVEFVWLNHQFDPAANLFWFDRFAEERPQIRYHCNLNGSRRAFFQLFIFFAEDMQSNPGQSTPSGLQACGTFARCSPDRLSGASREFRKKN